MRRGGKKKKKESMMIVIEKEACKLGNSERVREERDRMDGRFEVIGLHTKLSGGGEDLGKMLRCRRSSKFA